MSLVGRGIMPPAMLLVFPFNKTPLWMMIYFLGVIYTREEAFVEGFGRGWEETLSVDSNLNESTSMWWIKIDLPWIEPTTTDLRRFPGDTCQNTLLEL